MAKKRLTAEEIAERNETLLRYRQMHPMVSWDTIGPMFGITGRQASAIYNRRQDDGKIALRELTKDVAGELARRLRDLDDLAARFLKIAEETKQDAVQVGALRNVLDVYKAQVQILQQTKVLPNDLGVVRHQFDFDYLADKTLELITKFVPKKMREDAARFMLEATKPQLELVAGDADGESDAA